MNQHPSANCDTVVVLTKCCYKSASVFYAQALPVDDADHAVFTVIGAVDAQLVQQV